MVTHDVLFRGASFAGTGGAPVILQRTDDDFIANILRDVATGPGRSAIVSTIAAPPQGSRTGRVKLYQPVHQTFHVVLVEAACDAVGQPRLDPRSIDSMGLVIRRVVPQQDGRTDRHEAWLQAGRKLRAWQELAGRDAHADPDPARRPPALKAGHPEIDRRLALLRLAAGDEPLAETVAPLFLAPPEVCKALGKTLLYGLVPLATADRTAAPTDTEYSSDVVTRRMATYFREASHTRAVPLAGATLTSANAGDAALQDYVGMLAQLTFEFEAFHDTAAGRALLAALNAIKLPYAPASGPVTAEVLQPAGDELRRAAKVLVERDPATATVRQPLRWPPVTRQQADAIAGAVLASMRARFTAARQGGFVTGAGRFEDPAASYQLRTFIRVKRDDGCPPRLQWSDYSRPFVIAPWYDTNPNAPPAQVVIPEIKDVTRIKPNVAFKVPESIFNVIERNKKLDGLGRPGVPEIGLGWICAFNIPIITLCAFILLNIVLGMFNIIFSWMAFVKICIPFPKISAPAEE
jgi:hypothetical protein